MNMQIETRLSSQLERYLDMAINQSKLTAVNMANIDTPGYRSLDMDFEREMRQAIQNIDSGTPSEPARIRFEDGLVARPDGNNVSMDREGLNLAEAQLKFKTGITLMRSEYQRIMDAIHADK